MNSVNLIGNLGQTPEYSVFQSGKKVARFSIAINRYGKNQTPTWVPCEMWDSAVERLQKCSVRQGTKLSITGSLSLNEYDRQIGDQSIKQKKLYVKVFDFDVLTPKSSAEETATDESYTELIEEPTAHAVAEAPVKPPVAKFLKK